MGCSGGSSLGTQSGGAREARDDAFESHVQAGEEGPNFPPPHHPPSERPSQGGSLNWPRTSCLGEF